MISPEKASVFKMHPPCGALRCPLIVCDEHQRMPRPVQSVKQLQHTVCRGRIQSCGRLIRQNHARFCHDRPCDCHPLLLSAGKLVRPVIRPIGQANALQNRQCAFAPLMPRNALQHQRQRDIFQRCHAR